MRWLPALAPSGLARSNAARGVGPYAAAGVSIMNGIDEAICQPRLPKRIECGSGVKRGQLGIRGDASFATQEIPRKETDDVRLGDQIPLRGGRLFSLSIRVAAVSSRSRDR